MPVLIGHSTHIAGTSTWRLAPPTFCRALIGTLPGPPWPLPFPLFASTPQVPSFCQPQQCWPGTPSVITLWVISWFGVKGRCQRVAVRGLSHAAPSVCLLCDRTEVTGVSLITRLMLVIEVKVGRYHPMKLSCKIWPGKARSPESRERSEI